MNCLYDHHDGANQLTFMPLMKGSLKDLAQSDKDPRPDLLLKQILSALQYLASQTPSIIHQNVEPGNILYDFDGNDRPYFTLAGFGSSSCGEGTSLVAITSAFSAPEVSTAKAFGCYTTKMDVWSLLVTWAWVASKEVRSEIQNHVLDAASLLRFQHSIVDRFRQHDNYSCARAMAALHPSSRVSAEEAISLLSDWDDVEYCSPMHISPTSSRQSRANSRHSSMRSQMPGDICMQG